MNIDRIREIQDKHGFGDGMHPPTYNRKKCDTCVVLAAYDLAIVQRDSARRAIERLKEQMWEIVGTRAVCDNTNLMANKMSAILSYANPVLGREDAKKLRDELANKNLCENEVIAALRSVGIQVEDRV
jgi:hypothetical protein